MQDAVKGAVPTAPLVSCPDCGQEFVRRGLAAHRRMRHARRASIAVDAATRAPSEPPLPATALEERSTREPRPPLPASAATDAHGPSELVRAVEMLTDAVRRLDGHLDRLLEFQARVQPSLPAPAAVTVDGRTPECSALDRMTLERELELVLAEIARARVESECALASLVGGELEEERHAVELSTRASLGRLRRRQASVLARLLEFDQEEDAALDMRLLRTPVRHGASLGTRPRGSDAPADSKA